MPKKITPDIAREYQKRSAAARKKNAPERRRMREIADEILCRRIKSKTGEEKQVIEVLGEYILNKAINDKDINAIKYLLNLAGEGEKQQVEVDAKVQTIEPITGIQILPCNDEERKPKRATAKKTTSTKKKAAKKK